MTVTSESGTAHGVLDGRVVLITGGNGGIGLGMAKGCAAAGADLAAVRKAHDHPWSWNASSDSAQPTQQTPWPRRLLGA